MRIKEKWNSPSKSSNNKKVGLKKYVYVRLSFFKTQERNSNFCIHLFKHRIHRIEGDWSVITRMLITSVCICLSSVSVQLRAIWALFLRRKHSSKCFTASWWRHPLVELGSRETKEKDYTTVVVAATSFIPFSNIEADAISKVWTAFEGVEADSLTVYIFAQITLTQQ